MLDKSGFRRGWLMSAVIGLLALLVTGPSSHAQQIHRNAFEGARTAWTKTGADAAFEESAHTMSEQIAHDGQRSEYIKLNVQQGTYIHYQYATGRAPVIDDLNVGLWLKGNRPGMQLLARVVLPNERDPAKLDEHLTTFIRGDTYRNVGRWQRVEIGRPVQLLKEQQHLMQAQLRRSLNFTDAYVSHLVLNVYGGPGPTELWIDDLEMGPVFSAPAVQPAARPILPGTTAQPASIPRPSSRPAQVVEFSGSHVLVNKKKFFMRGIHYTDTPLPILRSAGFNTLHVDATVSPKVLKEAGDLGFWIVPTLKGDDPRLTSAEQIHRDVGRFTESGDSVLFWHLGGTLAYEQTVPVSRTAQLLKAADPGRPLGADVWDGLLPYSRTLQLVGVYRWPLMSTLELTKYREWLDQRRKLAHPGTFMWTWIQTHMPDWYTQLLYEKSASQGFTEPVGPQAEQIRLLTYTALSAGCRGLSFWSDRFLADSHQGRDRLLAVALLNQEIEMLEPLLATVDDPPQWIDTSVRDVKAAVLRTGKGVLVLPMWLGKGAQFVPGQAAVSKLSMVVPQVPQSMQAWEVCPADTHSLRCERVVGGTKITLNEFGLTTAVVFTSDTNLIIRFQEQARARRQLAAQFTYDQAAYEVEKVAKVQNELEKLGHTLPDAAQLMQDARNRLQTSKQHWDNRLFAEAYREGQRALRPLRILMRAQWEQAVKGLDSPVSSPYAVTFFTLPRHWKFLDQVHTMTAGANVLAGGDFETGGQRGLDNWNLVEPTLDEVELLAMRVGEVKQPLSARPGAVPTAVEQPHEGKQCLMLQIKPRNKGTAPQALERTLLALTSPSVRLTPGSLVQVSGWVRIPNAIAASADGALLYDNAGGEPLAIRLTDATAWKKFTLYRRVPASGIMNVTLALTGLGTVYFDDLRIEPLAPGNGSVTAAR
jgi:hypothetical protein